MTRILFFLLLAALAWIWFFRKPRQRDGDGDRAEPPAPAIESMVTCAHCGLRLPESEALGAGDEHYCCAGHRDEHAARR